MSLAQTRDRFSTDIIERRFIKKTLQDVGKDIDKAQRNYMSSRGFENNDWFSDRGFKVSDGEMEYTHLKKHRFVDMKTRMRKDGSKNRKKSRSIHNKIIWGQYNYLTRELAFGYTDAIKAEIQSLE